MILLKKSPIIIAVILSFLVFLVRSTNSKEIVDADITLAVDSQIKNDGNLPADMIDAITQNGIVTITGFVDNLRVRRRAAKVAKTVKGVRAVINRIKLHPSARADKQILLDIEQALQDKPISDIQDLSVNVQNGVVYLKGRLDSWFEETLCVKISEGVEGVRKVIPNFKVLMKIRRPDREIASEIKQRLAWDVWIDDDSIDVKVEKGNVFLSGVAGSLIEKTRVYITSWVVGVRSVTDNDLFIDWSRHNDMQRRQEYALLSDEEIKNAVKTAFSYDPRVLPFNFNIAVNIGVVNLSGHVKNLKTKRAAEQDAKNTTGVWRVQNHLKVRPDVFW